MDNFILILKAVWFPLLMIVFFLSLAIAGLYYYNKDEKEKMVCKFCGGPIRSGSAYIKDEKDRLIHWGCSMTALGDAVDGGPGIGIPDDDEGKNQKGGNKNGD